MANAESSFRSQLSNFRWANSIQDDSQAAAAPTASTSLWGSLTSGVSAYVPIHSNDRTNEEEAYFALSRWERFIAFLACIAGGLICFMVAFFTIPLLVLKPRKFAVAFTLGSFLFMMGFTILMGPMAHLKHLLSTERLPFTTAYFGSLGLTLFFAVGMKSYFGTIISAVVQLVALLSYLAAYFPGGLTTLRFGGQMALRGAGNVLPF
ncbi:er-to-golgi vesicle protein transport sft2 [Phaffia rhodozyma]|uniref:Protein transport protein SFT2 n=1 Tax=Phaffia rhodozyma TaxID=264483 RepID=A0A0F7SK66_PHARH|nr:er-to-golgi vesicle protein transport sft2 [Phaffia rhodozyma]